MFGLSIKNLRNSFSFNHIGGFSRELATVKKVFRWRFKRLFSPYPTLKEKVEANEYGITSDIRWHEVFADGFAESEITRVIKKRLRKDADFRKELAWSKEVDLFFFRRLRKHDNSGIYLFGEQAVFSDRGKFKACFFRARRHLGFFRKRFSSCADAKNVIGYAISPWDYSCACDGAFLYREYEAYKRRHAELMDEFYALAGDNTCWALSRRDRKRFPEEFGGRLPETVTEAIGRHVCNVFDYYNESSAKVMKGIGEYTLHKLENSYARKLALSPVEVVVLMKPFLRFVEAYKSMYTDLMADLKKLHKKNRFGRLFLSKEPLDPPEEDKEVNDTKLYCSWSIYCDGDRIPTWLRLLDKDRVYVFLDKSNKRAVPITDEEKLDWLLWRDKADVLRSSAEEVEIRLLW